MLRTLLFAFAAFWLLVQSAPAALAHAEMRGSSPAPNAILTTLPERVTLEFGEDVAVLALAWRLPDGRRAEAAADAASGTLFISPPPQAGKGSYALTWRVTSADGHPVSGALVFSLGHPSGQDPATETDLAAYLGVLLRSGLVVALVLAVGAAVYDMLVGPVPQKTAQSLGRAGFAVPLFGIALIGVEGADRLGGLSFLLTLQAWRSGLAAPATQAVLLATLAAALVAVPTGIARSLRGWLAWALAAASFAVAGHARAEPWPLMPLTALHAATMLFWVGGLVPLTAAVLDATGRDRSLALRRFSKPALPLVLLLVGSGLGLILHRAEAPTILASAWAALLGGKLVLVVAMLALAALHRFHLTDRLETSGATVESGSLRIETMLGLVVLVLAMGFRLAPPPAAVADPLPMTHFQKAGLMVMLRPSTKPPGQIGFSVKVIDRTHPDALPKEVRLSLSDPSSGILPIKVPAALHHTDWQTLPVTLPTDGPWQATITVLVSDFEAVKLDGTIQFGD